MKYIRTKDGIYKLIDFSKTDGLKCANHYGYTKDGINFLGTSKHFNKYKQANTIEELCDEFVFEDTDKAKWIIKDFERAKSLNSGALFGAIWADKGLIYVAKMNERGELELL